MQGKYFLFRGREAIGGETGGHLASVYAVSLGGILAEFWLLWVLRVVWADSRSLETGPSHRGSHPERAEREVDQLGSQGVAVSITQTRGVQACKEPS
jgi:hypothetical protein